MKTVMILGAGIYQVPLIKQAKKMGLRVIVVSYKGNYPGIPLADLFLDINTTDHEAVCRAAKEYGIDGIVTAGTDVCVPSLGYTAEKLGLPGPDFAAACSSMNKVLMKNAFKAYGVATAEHGSFVDAEAGAEFAASIGYPVMVKIPDSSGSRGVIKVNSYDEFAQAWNNVSKISRSKEIIVEKYLDGVEYGAQAFPDGKGSYRVIITDKKTTPPPQSAPVGHVVPADLPENIYRSAAEEISRAARSLKLKDCVVNADWMLVGDKPYILEIGARMGATCLPEIISLYTGVNVYEYLIRLALGETVEFAAANQCAAAARLLRSERSGVLEAVYVPDWIKQHPELVDLSFDYQPGEQVNKFTVGPDRIGQLIVRGGNRAEAEDLAEKMVADIEIKVKDAEE